jgi:glycosyltransferase involved in cell wall biosynthesis
MTSTPMPRADGSVAVVIPTYNRVELLRLTLASVLAQTLPPAELFVVDDGSTDSTAELLQELAVNVIRNPDGGWGPGKARNAALEQVSSEYVAFVDSDDLLLPDALERLRDALAAAPDAPFAFVRGLSARREPDGWRQEGLIGPSEDEQRDLLGSLFARNSVPASGGLVRTQVARRIGGYDPRVRWAEDHHFWIRAAMLGPPVHVPEIGCVYRRHAGNRYTPLLAEDDADVFLELAAGDSRLESHVPERLGVELCLRSLSAIKARHPGRAARYVLRLGLRGPHRLRVLGGAVRHYRVRRRWWRVGRDVWSARPDLREWLSAY